MKPNTTQEPYPQGFKISHLLFSNLSNTCRAFPCDKQQYRFSCPILPACLFPIQVPHCPPNQKSTQTSYLSPESQYWRCYSFLSLVKKIPHIPPRLVAHLDCWTDFNPYKPLSCDMDTTENLQCRYWVGFIFPEPAIKPKKPLSNRHSFRYVFLQSGGGLGRGWSPKVMPRALSSSSPPYIMGENTTGSEVILDFALAFLGLGLLSVKRSTRLGKNRPSAIRLDGSAPGHRRSQYLSLATKRFANEENDILESFVSLRVSPVVCYFNEALGRLDKLL